MAEQAYTFQACNQRGQTRTDRDYQINAVIETGKRVAAGKRRALIVAPTGSGKTHTAGMIIERSLKKQKRSLVVAHRRELIDQTVAKLESLGITNVGVIMAGDKRVNPDAPVQVASIQTLIRRELPPADLLIIDEAHRAISRGYMTLAANYPRAAILGLTATPERLDGKGLDHLFDDMVVVETVPGLIERGYLVKPRCYIGPTGDLSEVKTRRGDYDEKQLAEAMDRPRLVGDIISNWQRLARGRKTAVFATGVEHAKHIANEFWAAGVPAATLVGSTPKAEREAILADWRSGALTVVTSVMILVEGFDFPELECLVMARPTQSVSLYLQAAGRVLRPAQGKTDALILDHAGCVMNHGAPHIHREWTLEGAKGGKKREAADLFECPDCTLAFEPDPRLWLAEEQTEMQARHRSAMGKEPAQSSGGLRAVNPSYHTQNLLKSARDVLSGSKGARALSSCPGCGTATCRVCQNTFKPHAQRQDIDGIAWVSEAQCPHCGAAYSEDVAHIIGDGAGEREAVPDATDDQLVELTGDVVPVKVTVLNEYRALLKVARERGHKRGWVFHRLKDKYDEAVLNDCLPRHTGTWWKAQA